ncbi:S1C family serine protease [Nocardioides plantarum]|uniref:S1C family serine protease n=1 Tax=Nocardioides plantarum TaxID=29299 RepID=A0ABV5K983_9ACTN|nr:trypsin-like peptidase domain-containing protein [Nocardioides plantarum]
MTDHEPDRDHLSGPIDHPLDQPPSQPTADPTAGPIAAPTPVPPTRPVWAPPSAAIPPTPLHTWSDYARRTTWDAGPTAVFPGSPAGPVGPAGPGGHTGSGGSTRSGRPGAWVWPAVALLALVVGLLGGVAGSVAYDDASNDGAATPYRGLEDDKIVELPPVEAGGVSAVAEALLPSTVQIIASYEGQADGATGSGFVLDTDGHVITNNHVVASAAASKGAVRVVDQDGNSYDAEIVGRSPVYDIAVLQLPDDADLPPAALGASRRLRVGDGVVAIGSPLGLSATVTSGIVSALNRPVSTGRTSDDTSYINAVQTDAAINPGNSGGPLVNLRGQVVGVNSAIATNGGATNDDAGNIGVGFAIPVEQVRITADQILKTGEARYPVIGAKVGGTESRGVVGAELSEVLDGTPAQDAGLQNGDVVTEVDGQRVVDGISLIVSIRTHQPNERVEFTYVRDGKERTATLQLDSEVG